MQLERICKHLIMTAKDARSVFPPEALIAIEADIKSSEQLHSGEIRFVVESCLSTSALLKKQTAKERAIELFSQLRIWDTEHNNGLLIYLLLADRAVEVVADRGIHSKVNPDHWEIVCHTMEAQFKQGNFKNGTLLGIHMLTQTLKHYFPKPSHSDQNELPDAPLIL